MKKHGFLWVNIFKEKDKNKGIHKIIKSKFKEIRVFSRDEKKQEDFRLKLQNSKVKFYIGDTRNYSSIYEACKNVDYVFHAAALKQVPSCEFYPLEAINTNIHGTSNTIDAAIKNSVKKLILLSTDKAVYPINAMGVSKALMEKVAVANSRDSQFTKICITRYGNVMASRGSVIPHFVKQIKDGHPITITDPNVERYFMSISEAASLIIETLNLKSDASIYVLEMGERIKILDLAKKLINISGYSIKNENNPNGDIEIKYIGLQPGEKIFEELYSGELIKTENKNIYLCKEKLFSYNDVTQILNQLDDALRAYDSDKLFKILNKIKYN